MAQFTYYPANKLFNNIPPNINKSRHTGVLTHCFRSAYYDQS